MAVYKPTNCQPYLTTFDLLECTSGDNYSGEPTLFECKVDTSNTQVTAYAITLYNSDNTQIFPVDANDNPVEPQDNISFIFDLQSITGIASGSPISSIGYTNLNSGINGSYLHIPVFVDSAIANWGTVRYNSLIVNVSAEGNVTVNATSRAQKQEGGTYVEKAVTIENGQQYKWVITLFQGVKKTTVSGSDDPVFPTSVYEYDMIVTTGQVMGSNNERIQSYLSDQIYVDYYIQPVQIYDRTIVDEEKGIWTCSKIDIPDGVPRVRIKNYDSSYGYIYPQTGDSGFTADQINNSSAYNGFQIYSMGNNPEDLTETRKVAIANAQDAIPWTWNDYLTDLGQSYGTQVYYIPTSSSAFTAATENRTFYPFDVIRAGRKDYSTIIGLETTSSGVSWQNCFVQDGSFTEGLAVTSDTRVVLNAQHASNDYGNVPEGQQEPSDVGQRVGGNITSGSPFNGIYVPSIVFQETVRDADNSVVEGWAKVTITWNRSTDANTWGSLMNSIVYISGTGVGKVTVGSEAYEDGFQFDRGINIQTRRWGDDNRPLDSSTAYGAINSTPVKFYTELPEEIYTFTGDPLTNNENINTVGLILYNGTLNNLDANGFVTLYIRPFIGLEPKMWFRELTTSESASRFFLIESVNETTWAVKYDPDEVWTGNTVGGTAATNKLFDINQRYQIRTFYKSSDENPFNLYSNPTVTMTFGPMNKEDWVSGQGGNLYGTSGPDPVTIASRSFTVSAKYSQAQYIWWKSFNYTLYDMVGNQIATSGDRYDGLMDHTFYGLVDGNRYTLVLTIETYSGNILSLQQELLCSFTEQEISDSFPFDLTFDCSINAVRASFRLTGYIVPNVVDAKGNPTGRTVSRADNENDTSPKIKGVSYVNGAMLIAGGANGIDEEGVTYTHTSDGIEQIFGRSPLSTENNTVLIESSHTPTSTRFAGNFLCAYFSPDNSEDVLPDDYKFVVYIPDELIIDNEGTHANPDRNKVFYDVLGSNGASVLSDGPGEATLYLQGSSAPEASGKWRNDLIFLPEWQPSELENRFGSSSVVNYKPVDDAVFDMSNGISTQSYYKNINGPFNTTAEYIQKESGQGDNRIAIDWVSQAGSASQLKNPLILENDTLIQESSTSSANSIFVSMQTSDGDDFQASDHVLDEDEEPSTYNNFVLVNKMPTLWGDGGFVIASTTGETTLWPIVSISATEENGSGPHVATGYIARSYFEQTDKDNCFVWNDDPVVVNEVTYNGRWFDGWGIDNNTATVEGSVIGLNEDDEVVSVTRTYTQEYDADDSNRIYVGNQTQITDGSLTRGERSAIISRTFVIQANIGLNEESSTITTPDVRVYITNN